MQFPDGKTVKERRPPHLVGRPLGSKLIADEYEKQYRRKEIVQERLTLAQEDTHAEYKGWLWGSSFILPSQREHRKPHVVLNPVNPSHWVMRGFGARSFRELRYP